MRLLIILITFIAVGVTIATIVVGNRSFEGIVVERPYENGLAWDQVHREKVRLGWSVSLLGLPCKTGRNEMEFSVLDRNGLPLSDAVVNVVLSRPATSALDRTYSARRGKDGHYRVSVDFPQFGYWDVRIEVKQKDEECIFMEKIYAGRA
jgi:nitrogen fixation protein FixH